MIVFISLTQYFVWSTLERNSSAVISKQLDSFTLIFPYSFYRIWSTWSEPCQAISSWWIYCINGFLHGIRFNGTDFRPKIGLRDRFQSGIAGNGRIQSSRFIFLVSSTVCVIVTFSNPTVNRRPYTDRINHFVRNIDICAALDRTLLWTVAKSKTDALSSKWYQL